MADQRRASKKQARPKTNKQQPSKTSNARPPKKASDMSQDEAALVIQKQFRGYQARKEYGPIISSEKMSSEVAMFVKEYCRKWKAKSLFQVLLMYRAARHQDFVYFSQQVHLYNQNAVSAMIQSNKEHVSLHNIDTDTTPSKYLGPFTPRMFKLPFRLNDMPFCDSSYLCTTMSKRTLGKDEPWDDPYKRRSRILSATGKCSELENAGLSVEEGGDVFSFIQTPYTRDPSYIDVVYTGQPYRKGDHYFTAKSGKDRRNSRKKVSAPPVPKGSYNNFSQSSNSQNNNNFGQSSNSQFGQSGNSNYSHNLHQSRSSQFTSNDNSRSGDFNRSASPASSYIPQKPNANFAAPQGKASQNGNPNYSRDKLKPLGDDQRQNPIKELEMKFKQINNNEEETPTFNFQAMLRKTDHKRASLRRSSETDNSSYGQGNFPSIPEQKSVNQSNNYMNTRNNNTVYNSSAARGPRPLNRQDSADCRKAMSHHYKESVKRARNDEVTTEIAPGIVIQGQVAEL